MMKTTCMLLPMVPQQSGCILSSCSRELHLPGGYRGKMGVGLACSKQAMQYESEGRSCCKLTGSA